MLPADILKLISFAAIEKVCRCHDAVAASRAGSTAFSF
jgi:hypothetical protein